MSNENKYKHIYYNILIRNNGIIKQKKATLHYKHSRIKNNIESPDNMVLPQHALSNKAKLSFFSITINKVLKYFNIKYQSTNLHHVKFRNNTFYAGFRFLHYGHFLLESLSRLSHYNNESWIIWSGHTQPFSKYESEILSLLGLLNKKHFFIQGEAHFKQISIPPRGYIIWDFFYDYHARFLSTATQNKQSFYFNKKVWLSRNGSRTFKNEPMVQKILKQNGWLIIQPETLEIHHQIEIFTSAKAIAGIEGSAFHTIVLCKDICKKIYIFSRGEKFNGNYITIDKTLNTKQNLIISKTRDPNEIDISFVLDKLSIKA